MNSWQFSRSRLRLAGVLALLLSAGCRDSTEPSRASSLVFVGGVTHAGLAGTLITTPLVAQVRDQYENGMPGVSVTFAVVAGGGTLDVANATTDADGKARASGWVLGKYATRQAIQANALDFAATLEAAVITDYSVDLRFFGPPMPPAAAQAFTEAAARISASVVGDLPDFTPASGLSLSDCSAPGVTLSDRVDDVVIYAAVRPIDGPNRILASAGPCLLRSAPGSQTIAGVMVFDSADIDLLITRNVLRDVIQHEMYHVVGVGTLWDRKQLIAGARTTESRFTGQLGVGACVGLGGASVCPSSVPLETTGGSGTADGHWRESVFHTELMTGFVNLPPPNYAGIANPLSTITIQSLGDLGYAVNPAAADTYGIPGITLLPFRAAVLAGSEGTAGWEEVLRPRFELTPIGTIQRVIAR